MITKRLIKRRIEAHKTKLNKLSLAYEKWRISEAEYTEKSTEIKIRINELEELINGSRKKSVL